MNNNDLNNEVKKTHNIKEYRKLWYAANKEKRMEYNQTKMNCDICNCIFAKGSYYVHIKSRKHLENQEKNNNKIIKDESSEENIEEKINNRISDNERLEEYKIKAIEYEKIIQSMLKIQQLSKNK